MKGNGSTGFPDSPAGVQEWQSPPRIPGPEATRWDQKKGCNPTHGFAFADRSAHVSQQNQHMPNHGACKPRQEAPLCALNRAECGFG